MFFVEHGIHKEFGEAEDAVSQRTYLAISALAAVSGVLLLLVSPAVGMDLEGYVQPLASAGSTGAGLWWALSGHWEQGRMVGGLLLGTGLMNVLRASRGAEAPGRVLTRRGGVLTGQINADGVGD